MSIRTAPLDMAAKPTTAPAPVHHRWWFPISLLFLLVCAFAVPVVFKGQSWIQPHLLDIAIYVEMFGVLGVALLVTLWWLFFSRFSWLTRLGVVLLLAGGVTWFVMSFEMVDTFFWRGVFMVPRFAKTTGKTTKQVIAEDRAGQQKTELPPIDLTVGAQDFPRYRGVRADGTTSGVALLDDWTKEAPRIRFSQKCGKGYSGFAVAGNVAITVEQRDDKEAIVCYDRTTGQERWSCEYPASFNGGGQGKGPRATPAIDRGQVFSLGATGELVCVNGATGEIQWHHNVLEDNGSTNVVWGLTGSPLVVNDFVVVNPGVNPANPAGKAVAAYNRNTGERVWAIGDHKASYSSPCLATLDGVEQILLFDADGLTGLDPANGKEHWRYPWATFGDMNIIQPLVCGKDGVFISSETRNGCALLRVHKEADGQWTVKQAWKSTKLAARFANPVLVGPGIFGLHLGNLVCLDAETGDLFWEGESFGAGQLLAVGDRLLVISDEGEIALVAAETTAYKELGRFRVFANKTWTTPALAGNELFLRCQQGLQDQMACVVLPAAPAKGAH